MKLKVICLILFSLFSVSCGYTRLIRIPQHIPVYSAHPTLLPDHYMAGVAKDIITPPVGSWLAGFLPSRRSTGVYDNPEVRALAFSDGKSIHVFLTMDTIGLQRTEVKRIRRAVNIPNLTIDEFSSHTHSAGDVIGIWGLGLGEYLPLTSGRDEDYIDTVVERSAKVITAAVNNMEPVTPYIGHISAKGVSKNRREPKILDQDLFALFFVLPAKPLNSVKAIIVNFGCHPEALHRDNRLITADFVAPMREKLDAKFETTTLFVNGALGGMVQPNFAWKDAGTFAARDETGEKLAHYTGDARYSAHRVTSETITYKKEVVRIPLKNKPLWLMGLLGFMDARPGSLLGGVITTEVSVMRFGKTAIVMVPGEIVPELSLQIKAAGGPGTQVWSLADDEIGYILNPEKFNLPLFSYERTVSVGPDEGRIVVDTAIKLLSETAQK